MESEKIKAQFKILEYEIATLAFLKSLYTSSPPFDILKLSKFIFALKV